MCLLWFALHLLNCFHVLFSFPKPSIKLNRNINDRKHDEDYNQEANQDLEIRSVREARPVVVVTVLALSAHTSVAIISNIVKS